MKSPQAALLAGALLLLMVFNVPSVSAGTEAVPEITDPQYDQIQPDLEVPVCSEQTTGTPACIGGRIDVLKLWIDNETATTFDVHVSLSTDPTASAQTDLVWEFHATPAGGASDVVATVTGTAQTVADPGPPPTLTTGDPEPGSNVLNVSSDDTSLTMTIAKSIYGGNATGLTKVYVLAQQSLTVAGVPQAVDLAPDVGAASTVAFNFTVANPPGGPDSDSDGLDDAFELEHFGDLNQTGSGDQDNDGLTNFQEQSLGTDPTKADTDGDGFGDKTEADAGTDPTDPNSKPNTTNPPPPPPPNPNPPPPPVGPNPPPPPSPDPGDGGEDSFMDKLTANPQYLGIAAGGAAVLLIVALIGIFGRWGA